MTASIAGFYAVYMSGKAGPGFALLIFSRGRIVGADASHFMYDGDYLSNLGKSIDINLNIKAPPNVPLVQGGTTGPEGEESILRIAFPMDFASKDFLRVETARGPVNVKIVKIRDIDE